MNDKIRHVLGPDGQPICGVPAHKCEPPPDEFGNHLPPCDQQGTAEYEPGKWICDTHYAMVDLATGRLCSAV